MSTGGISHAKNLVDTFFDSLESKGIEHACQMLADVLDGQEAGVVANTFEQIIQRAKSKSFLDGISLGKDMVFMAVGDFLKSLKDEGTNKRKNLPAPRKG